MFSYPPVLIYVLGAQKNRLIETVLLSTHNICFGWEIGKITEYALLTINWSRDENGGKTCLSRAEQNYVHILFFVYYQSLCIVIANKYA